MPAADEREALRRAGMAREDSSCRLRVRYRKADVESSFLQRRVHCEPDFLDPDKSCFWLRRARLPLDRCHISEGTVAEAVRQTAAAKRAFTLEDVHARGGRLLGKCIANDTTRIRTHVEADPGIGLLGHLPFPRASDGKGQGAF
jgi:hypothetical protein